METTTGPFVVTASMRGCSLLVGSGWKPFNFNQPRIRYCYFHHIQDSRRLPLACLCSSSYVLCQLPFKAALISSCEGSQLHIILFKVKCTRVVLSGWRCQGLEADSQLWYLSPIQFQHSQRLLQAIIIFKKVWKGKGIAVFRFGSAATSNLQIGCDFAAFLVMILVLGRAAGSARSL